VNFQGVERDVVPATKIKEKKTKNDPPPHGPCRLQLPLTPEAAFGDFTVNSVLCIFE
jgi:hypothetical protein